MPIVFQPHECQTPLDLYPVDTYWACEKCHKVWRLGCTYGRRQWYVPMLQGRLRKRFGL